MVAPHRHPLTDTQNYRRSRIPRLRRSIESVPTHCDLTQENCRAKKLMELLAQERSSRETRLIEIQGLRAFSKRLKVAYPKPEVILEKLSAFTLVSTDMAQTFAFEVFAIGYDFDFNPICPISMKAYDRTSLEWSFREILGLLPTDDFINQDDTYLSAGIQVRYCEGGRFRTTSNSFVAFCLQEKGRNGNRRLQVRLKLSTGLTVRIVVLICLTEKNVWGIYVDLEDRPGFWDEVKRDRAVEEEGLVDSD